MQPQISVVIPCRNEANYIETCVSSVLNSSFPKDALHIAVVDGMSTDGTREILYRLSKEHPCVHMIDNPAQITPVAMNLGIASTQSEYVMIMGAHSTISENYITHAIDLLQQNSHLAGVGGVINNVYRDAKSALIGKAMSSSFGVGNAHFRTGNFEGDVDTIGTPVYRREVLNKTGLFDERLVRNQDDELNHRIRKTGLKLRLTNQIRFDYVVRASWQKMFKQYRQYGYWKVYVNKKHNTVTTLRQLVPAAFVLFLFIVPLGALLLPEMLLVWLSVCALWLLAATAFAAKKVSVTGVPALVWTFFLLHFSYGTGYLEGIWHFLILRRNPAGKKAQLTR